MFDDIRSRLQESEDKIRGLREDRARLSKVFEAAKAAAEETETDGTLAAAVAAKESLAEVDQLIEQATDMQLAQLKQLGDFEAGKSGFVTGLTNGWETAARTLSLNEGTLRADVPAASLLLSAQPRTPAADPAPVSNRFLFPALRSEPFGADPGDIVATDYTVSFDEEELTGTLSPSVERDVDAITEKATMSPTVNLATPKAKMYAAVLDRVPSQVFDSQASLQALLQNELARQLARSFDAAVVDAIEGASPPSGSTGSDLVSKIRNAISDATELGSEPSVIGLSPADAAAYDLSDDGNGAYLFIPATTSQAVAWRLQVREVPGLAAPTLIDVDKLGVVYTGDGSVVVDPFTALTTNEVRVRVETAAVLHIRNPVQGAFVIA
jgi:hypothetical protein